LKNLAFVVLFALALSACTSIPEPQNAGDALLIGSLVLDFPDGFLGQPARTVRSNLLLHFRNITRNTRFCRLTTDGYFYFHGHGDDQYELERYEYSVQDQGGEYYLNDRITQRFACVPGKLVYAGHLTIRYAKPRISNRVSFAQSTNYDDEEFFSVAGPDRFPLIHRMRQTYWQYDRAIDHRWDEDALHTFLNQKAPRSSWLQVEITR
jgi:hypothetical protein